MLFLAMIHFQGYSSQTTCLLEHFSFVLQQSSWSNHVFDSVEYGNIVEELRHKAIFKDSSTQAGDRNISDSLAAGISLQLQQTLGLSSHILQKQNIDIKVLETKIKKREARFIIQKNISFDPTINLNEIIRHMRQLEFLMLLSFIKSSQIIGKNS